MGKSGTGKTTVTNILKKKYGLKMLNSYTTRPKRTPNERGHRFVTDEEFEKLKKDMCAYTEFDGYKYCATNRQVRAADVYVIDPAGIDYFVNNYRGKKKVISVQLLAQRDVRYKRMRERGDSFYKAVKRLWHDRKAFAKPDTDLTVNANLNDPEQIADQLMSSVQLITTMHQMNKEMGKDNDANTDS